MYSLGMRKREFPVFQNQLTQSRKSLNLKGFKKLKDHRNFQFLEPLD